MRKSFCAFVIFISLLMSCIFTPVSYAESIAVAVQGATKIDAHSFSDSYDYSTGGQLQKASNSGGKLIGVNYNDSVTFSLNIQSEGIYALSMEIATPEESNALQKFDISVDGEVVHKTELMAGKGMNIPVENFAGVISLQNGEKTLTFTATSASMYLFCIKLERLVSTDLGDLKLVENQGLSGDDGFLTFVENSTSTFKTDSIEAGFYKMSFSARAEENSTINISSSGKMLGVINIEGEAFYETALYCYLKESDTLFKIAALEGNVDFARITLTRLSDDGEAILTAFAENVNNAETEGDVKQAIFNAKEVLHPDGNYPEEEIAFTEMVFASLLNKGYRNYQEISQDYFKSVGKEKNNPTIKLMCDGESIKKIKSGSITVELDKERISTKTAIAAIYENGRLKYISSFLSADGESPKAEFGNVVLGNETNSHIKVFFIDSLESISPTDTKIFKEIYVDCLGNDETGDGSINAPFKTIKRAKEKVAEISDFMNGDIVVNIASGEYFISETEVFDGLCSGKNGFNVIYKGVGETKPEISGGVRITQWSPYKEGIYCATLDSDDELRNLYVNGYSATRARSEKLYEMREYYNSPDTEEEKDGFVIYPYQFPETIYKIEDAELVFNTVWTSHRLKVKDIIRYSDEIIFVTDSLYYDDEASNSLKLTAGRKFYIENDLTLLDKPGEFYFSKDDKTLYYYPLENENIYESEIYVPQTEFLIDIKGTKEAPVKNMQFKNLDIKYGVWNEVSDKGIMFRQADSIKSGMGYEDLVPGQIKLNYAENVLIEDCIFSCLGSAAISLNDGVHKVKINGNIIRDISGSGIIIGTDRHSTNKSDELRCKNISVTNNVIARPAQEYLGNVAICVYYEKGVEILNNTITETPYTGIHVGWGWLAGQNVDFGYYNISNNRIEDVMCTLDDGAHIYTLGAMSDSIIKNNYIKTSGANYGGIYNDTGSCKMNIFENVIEDVSHSWSIWNESAEINTYSNYATVDLCQTAGGKTITGIGDITIFDALQRPKRVEEIIFRAGVSEKYRHLTENAKLPYGQKSIIKNIPSEELSWKEYYIPVSGKKQAVLEGQYFIDTYHTDRYDGVIHNSGMIYLSYNQGEWITYRINVLEEGMYNVKTLYAFYSETLTTALGVSLDGQAVLTGCNIPVLSSWSEWQEQSLGNIYLTKGNHEITFKVEKGGLHMRNFMFNKIN